MLKSVRSLIKGPGAIIVVIMLILAFVFFGAPDMSNFRSNAALKVGEQEYSGQEVEREFTRQLNNIRRRNEQNITKEDAIRQGLGDQVVGLLTTRSAMRADAEELGITVSKSMIREYLQQQEGLKNPVTGKFDNAVLEQILRNTNMSINEFRHEIQLEMIQQQMTSAMQSPIAAPEVMVSAVLLRQSEQRDISYLTVPLNADDVPDPEEQTLTSFYAENADQYKTPKYTSFRAVILRSADFIDSIEVADEDLRKIFEIRKSRLETPETRTLRQLTFDTQEVAAAAATQLNQGTDFTTVATAAGQSVEDVTFEKIERGEIVTGEALFAVENAGAIVGPVETPLGFAVAEIVEIFPGSTVTFEEQEEALRLEAAQEAASRKVLEVVEEIEAQRDEGATIEEAIAGYDEITLQSFGPVDSTLMTPGGAIINDLPLEVLREAGTLDSGDESDAMPLADNDGYFFLVVDEVLPEAIKPLADIREDVLALWKQDQTRVAAQAKIDSLKAKIDGENDFKAVAEEAGLEVNTQTVSVSVPPKDLSVQLLREIYNTPLNESVSGTNTDNTALVLAKVTGATLTPPPNADAVMDIYRSTFGAELNKELYESYLQATQAELGVKVDQAQINQIFSISE